jgi:hypothetical protein
MSGELKAHYLRLYKAADDILKGPDNPCQIKVVDGQATCVKSRENNSRAWGHAHGTLCCGGCKHHDLEKGCTVQALGCKLGWCYCNDDHISGMKTEDHPMFVALAKLRQEAFKLGVPMTCRASFEENFPQRLRTDKID